MQRHWPLSDVRKGGRERGCRGKKRGLPSDTEMRGGEWIGRARIVLLVFLSRLYTMGAWAWVWWRGTRLLCQQGMQWRQPYCQTKTYQATLSVQKGKQMINIFFRTYFRTKRVLLGKLLLMLMRSHRSLHPVQKVCKCATAVSSRLTYCTHQCWHINTSHCTSLITIIIRMCEWSSSSLTQIIKIQTRKW